MNSHFERDYPKPRKPIPCTSSRIGDSVPNRSEVERDLGRIVAMDEGRLKIHPPVGGKNEAQFICVNTLGTILEQRDEFDGSEIGRQDLYIPLASAKLAIAAYQEYLGIQLPEQTPQVDDQIRQPSLA